MEKKDLVNINVRVPLNLKLLIEEYVRRDLHANFSEFCRDALREKLQHDAPELYRRLILGESDD